METRIIDKAWRMPDELWLRIEPLLPKYPPSPLGGRPRLKLRKVMDGVFYVLRTGCQWKALPPEFGSASAVHEYFQLVFDSSASVSKPCTAKSPCFVRLVPPRTENVVPRCAGNTLR